MHKLGTSAPEVKACCQDLNDELERLFADMKEDSLIIFTPDHGMRDVLELTYEDKKDFVDTLVRPPVLEPRCSGFYVKEGREEEFKELFEKYFGEHFVLYTAEEILEKKIMGEGTPHPLTRKMLGDFVGISVDEYLIRQIPLDDPYFFRGQHAGLTEEEMRIPLVVIKKD